MVDNDLFDLIANKTQLTCLTEVVPVQVKCAGRAK